MNLGQTMITIGMFVLLVMSVISANRMLLENTEATYTTEAVTGAGTVAQDLLQEAMSKKFDANDDGTGTQDTSAFVLPASLGPNAGEQMTVQLPDTSYTGNFKSTAGYNDIDDYNGYIRRASANNISGFTATVTVCYVSEFDPETEIRKRTFYKLIKVTVTHPQYMTDRYLAGGLTQITLSGLLSY